MSLTVKQRTKINAALCTIHDSGHDASAVTALARTIMATGVGPNTAYERALNTFADNNPAMLPVLSKIVRLVEASDVRTVAQYDAALSNYIATGDDSGLTALAPMIAEDMTALAIRNGEEPPEFDPELLQGAAPAEPQTSTFAFNTEPAPETVAGRPVVGRNADGQIVRTVSQLSLSQNVTGMVAPKAAREAGRNGYTGFAPTPGPGANAPNFAAAKEAARAAVANGSRVIIGEGVESA
jgi:hypothetical protein